MVCGLIQLMDEEKSVLTGALVKLGTGSLWQKNTRVIKYSVTKRNQGGQSKTHFLVILALG